MGSGMRPSEWLRKTGCGANSSRRFSGILISGWAKKTRKWSTIFWKLRSLKIHNRKNSTWINWQKLSISCQKIIIILWLKISIFQKNQTAKNNFKAWPNKQFLASKSYWNPYSKNWESNFRPLRRLSDFLTSPNPKKWKKSILFSTAPISS